MAQQMAGLMNHNSARPLPQHSVTTQGCMLPQGPALSLPSLSQPTEVYPTLNPSPSATPQSVGHQCAGTLCLQAKSGKPLHGSKNCCFLHCARCCDHEFEEAIKLAQFRLQCPGHGHHLQQWHSTPFNSITAMPVVAPTLPPVPDTAPSDISSTPGSLSQSQLTPLIPAPGDHPATLQGFLKPNSIGPLWNAASRVAAESASKNQERKANHRKLKTAHHRMVILVVWHQVISVFYMPLYVLTWCCTAIF